MAGQIQQHATMQNASWLQSIKGTVSYYMSSAPAQPVNDQGKIAPASIKDAQVSSSEKSGDLNVLLEKLGIPKEWHVGLTPEEQKLIKYALFALATGVSLYALYGFFTAKPMIELALFSSCTGSKIFTKLKTEAHEYLAHYWLITSLPPSIPSIHRGERFKKDITAKFKDILDMCPLECKISMQRHIGEKLIKDWGWGTEYEKFLLTCLNDAYKPEDPYNPLA